MKRLFFSITLILMSYSIMANMYNQKKATMSDLKGSLRVINEVIIDAPVESIFPLACPVREYDWISGWKCKLNHFPNGSVENGIVFTEIMSAPVLMGKHYGKTKWTAIKNDTINYKRFYQLENKISTTLVRIEMYPHKNGMTRVVYDMTYNAKTNKAELLIKNDLDKKLKFLVSMLGKMLKYYCENNTAMPNSQIMKYSKKANFFTFNEKHNMFLNKLAMICTFDKNRGRYFNGKEIIVN